MQETAAAYRFGEFQIDCAKRRLWRGAELVPLTPKAFETLVVLAAAAPAVVEKDELLKAVWPGTFVEEATLAQNISTIRKALGETSETPTFIATVPRRGYQFIQPVTQISTAGPAVASPPGPPASWVTVGRPEWVLGAVVLGLITAFVGVRVWSRPQNIVRPVAFTVLPPDGQTFSSSGSFMAVAPDGRRIGFVAVDERGISRLWLRPLDFPAMVPLAGTEGASQPFWSADGRTLAFFADGKLKKIDVSTGSLQTICTAPSASQPLAGTWSEQDDILFASIRGGIFRVPAQGGTASPLVVPTGDFDSVLWPQFLPDGRHFLFVATSMRSERAGIYVGSLDSNERRQVSSTRSYAVYAPPGHLLFIEKGMLVAQPFDVKALRTTAPPVPIADQVWLNVGTGRGMFGVSTDGVLAYRMVGGTQMTWFDRNGQPLGSIGPIGQYLQFSLSPDDGRVAAVRVDPSSGRSDIWVIDGGGDARQLTFEGARTMNPLWSRDGSDVVFASDRRGRWEIRRKSVDSGEPDEELLSSEYSVVPAHWSADDRLLFFQWHDPRKGNFWLLPMNPGSTPRRLPYLGRDENAGRISPDGRWLASSTWESGWSVHVRPLQSGDGRWQLSAPGQVEPQPRWRADGRELFYLADDMSLTAVAIESGSSFRAGSPHPLFRSLAMAPSGATGNVFDVASDGRRFLMKIPRGTSPITVVANWTALIGVRSPIGK